MNRRYASIFFAALVALGQPSHADVWSESYDLEAMAQYEAAAALFDPLLEKQPADEFALLRRAWLHYLGASYNDAQADYRAALRINPQSLDARIGLTLPLLAQRRWREAAVIAQEALEIAPWNYYAHVRLMVAEEGQQQWRALLEHATAVHQRYPSDATVLVYQARAQYWLGDKKSAGATYQAVLKRVPGHVEAMRFLSPES